MLTKGEGKSINFIVQNSFPLSLTLRLFSLFSPLCRLCLWSRMLSPRMCHYWNSYKFCVGCVGECCRMAGRSWADPPWRLSRRALEVKFVKHTHTNSLSHVRSDFNASSNKHFNVLNDIQWRERKNSQAQKMMKQKSHRKFSSAMSQRKAIR